MGDERAVLLLDLENAIGMNPRPEVLASRLVAIQALAEPIAVSWAAYPTRLLSEQSRKVLKEHGVKTRWAKAGKDGADKALVKLARTEAAKGRRRFVVASADADFAAVADLGTLEVIIRPEQKINKRLSSRAAKIHRLPQPSRLPPIPSASSSMAASTATAAELGEQTHPSQESAGEQSSQTLHCQLSARQLAEAGVALWLGGVCFGVGVTVGSVLTRRLLQHGTTHHASTRS